MERKDNEFIKVNPPRTFGSMWVAKSTWVHSIPMHELIDGKWVITPEYQKFLEDDERK